MKKQRLFLILAALAVLGAGVWATRSASEFYPVYRDLAYGSHARQKLDIYLPPHANNAPVVLFFYGGAWQVGSKEQYRFIGEAFARKGLVAVLADYRLYPEVKFPAFVEDGANAFQYVREHIAAYHGDPERIFVAGHSAGAYIAMMLGADPKRSGLRGTIGLAGPYDFLPSEHESINAIFSTASKAEMQPIDRIRTKIAPVFLATGETDNIVPASNSHHVKAKLKTFDSPVEEHIYPEVGHMGLVLSINEVYEGHTSLLDDIVAFVKAH